MIKYSSNDDDQIERSVVDVDFAAVENNFFFKSSKMNKLICLCLISLQLVGGISDSSIFRQPENVISEILNVFASNFTQLIRKVEDEVDVPDKRNDQLCMEQISAIVNGLNNSELWAIKSECLMLKCSIKCGLCQNPQTEDKRTQF